MALHAVGKSAISRDASSTESACLGWRLNAARGREIGDAINQNICGRVLLRAIGVARASLPE